MGVQAALGYQHKAGNLVHRTVRSMAGSKPGAVFFSKTIQPVDGAVQKLTGNTSTATELLAVCPSSTSRRLAASPGSRAVHP